MYRMSIAIQRFASEIGVDYATAVGIAVLVGEMEPELNTMSDEVFWMNLGRVSTSTRNDIVAKYMLIKSELTQTKKTKKRFEKPSVEEVRAYCLERNNGIDPQSFIDHYDSNGWMVGRTPMRDWKAAVRTWERRRNNAQPIVSGNRHEATPNFFTPD